jgi:hypothetical protein
MGIGIGVVMAIIIISLIVSKVHGSFSLGQAFYFVFIGLLVASVDPGLATTCHNFIVSLTTNVQSTNLNK